MVKRKRVSLSVRLQPYSETLLAEVVNWLNSVERDEAKRMIEAALIMAYLPYARVDSGATSAELERCCWETQDLLDKHGFNLRQALGVSQPQWRGYEPTRSLVATASSAPTEATDSTVEEETDVSSPLSKIESQDNYHKIDALFGDS